MRSYLGVAIGLKTEKGDSTMPDPNAKLTKVSIRIDTHNDNKDDNTQLNVAIKNRISMFLSQDMAEGLEKDMPWRGMEFVDPSSHAFDLVLKSKTLTLKDITLPVVNIHIQPNGNDRWIFDYTVTLLFDDGTSVSSNKKGVILDQDNRDHTGVFEG
jgi:hypothetical protein